MCRQCKTGYGPAVYVFSFICAEYGLSAAAGWMLIMYLFCVLITITVFYIFVIIFNIQLSNCSTFFCLRFNVPDILYDGVNIYEVNSIISFNSVTVTSYLSSLWFLKLRLFSLLISTAFLC